MQLVRDISMDKSNYNTCFTIMPFTVREADLGRYYGDVNHWNEVYQGLIAPSVKNAGLECVRDDEDLSSRLIIENIWRKIEQSKVVLCDLSATNPNVYLELGWALRADKRFVLIKDDITPISFDLNQYYTYEYSHRLQPSKLQSSIVELSDVLRSTLEDEKRSYSMVNKLALDMQATKAAAEGNVEVSLLKELLHEIRSSVAKPTGSIASQMKLREIVNVIHTQEDLRKWLIGTTWRKKNDIEMLIFKDNGIFYNNWAGYPEWIENRYELGDSLGNIKLFWSEHNNAYTVGQFMERFTKLVEVNNPEDCIWTLVSLSPRGR